MNYVRLLNMSNLVDIYNILNKILQKIKQKNHIFYI